MRFTNISLFLSFLILGGCNLIPFLGHDVEDRTDLNNLLILAIAQDNRGTSGGSVRPCNGPNGGPINRRMETEVASGSAHFGAGYSQVTSIRQNAYAYKRTGDRFDWCRYYDNSPADTRGVLPAVNASGTELFVAFTTDGGNASFRATAGAVQSSYGRGGGPKVTFLARINPDNGGIRNATFLGARLPSNGNTNTLNPKRIILSGERVTFEGITFSDGGSSNDRLDRSGGSSGPNCITPASSSGKVNMRTVNMPLELTRDSNYSATCTEVDSTHWD